MRAHRPGGLVVLWISVGLSIAGSTVVFVAIPWFVLITTGSATRVGLVTAAEVLGLVLCSALSGPVVDRVGARRTAIAGDLVGATAVGLIPILHTTGGLAFWVLVVLSALLGASRGPGHTARRALVPDLVAASGIPLERAAGGVDGASRLARMCAAPAAGAALVVTDAPSVLALNALLFLSAAAVTGAWVPRRGGPWPSDGYLSDLRAGLHHLRGDRLLLAIIAMLLFTNMLDMATAAVLYPVYSERVLHSPAAFGAITGIMGGAAVVGVVAYSWLGQRFSRHVVFTLAFLIAGVPRYVVLALEPGLPTVLVAVAVAGLAAGAVNPVLAVVFYQRVPADKRGRVLSLTTAVDQAGMPLGALIGGVLVDGIGLVPTLWWVAVAYLLATLVPICFPVWRRMDETVHAEPSGSPVDD